MPELGEHGGHGGSGHTPAAASAGNGGHHLNASNACEKNIMGGGRIGQTLNPSAADFIELTLNNPACIKDESGHVNAALG
ncbi:MAG: hypothetical protein WBQ11_23615 [Isosphaeraceae bacterium]